MRMFRVGYAWSAVAAFVLTAASAMAQDAYTPVSGWDHQLFPSYLIATATVHLPSEDEVNDDSDPRVRLLGDRQGVLGVELTSDDADTNVTVTIMANAILEESALEVTLDEEGTVYRVFPRIRYKYDALAKNKQSVPIEVTFNVTVGDQELESQTVTLTLRSINDCPYAVEAANEEVTDLSFMFAAYVNEQHPFVDKLLREALDQDVVDSFTGYQSGDPAEVYRQVYALWNALSERDVRYSNITTSAATTNAVSSQHVRLIDESINNGQANCVDGSVLIASLLRKIDIEPLLVYVPGHCYLAFYLDAEQTQMIGLETTLIGGASDDDARDLPGVEDVVSADAREKASWATFCAAVAVGNADLAQNQDKFNQDDVNYQVVSIAAARQMGILPIAFDSASEFKALSAAQK
jgi:hypothetical protein